jgi:hypothetical protein
MRWFVLDGLFEAGRLVLATLTPPDTRCSAIS